MSSERAAVAPRARIAAAIAAAALAATPVAVFSGFTVDDALIPARYALSLASGDGYRPSAGAPVSDGVTPLGFAHLLVPFAGGGVLAAHHAARAIGVAAWIAAAAGLGDAIARLGGSRLRFAALALLATSAPLGAWAIAGLETGLVTAGVAAALALREAGHDRSGALVVGLAAAWRPELAPFAVIIAFAAGAGAGSGSLRWRWETSPDGSVPGSVLPRVLRVALVIAPIVIVAATRFVAFGRAAPLSAMAKVPVLALGVSYAGAAALLAGLIAVVAPMGLLRASGWTRALALAVLVHVAAMAVAGGDWMPLARLAVPVAPAAVLVAARLLAAHRPGVHRGPPAGALAFAAAVALQVFGAWRAHPAVRDLVADRAALIEEMRPVLAGAEVVASIDVGWVGAAAPHARLVDLAGVTDPTVAALGGGHTARRIPRSLLDDRRVDALVMLVARSSEPAPDDAWTALRYARGTEAWIASIPGIGEDFALVHAAARRPRYVVVTRRATAAR